MSSVPETPAVVHLDLDGAADVFRVHGWRYEADEDPLFDRGLPRALDFFDEAGVRATLFVIAGALENRGRRARLREAIARGHEVASHTTTHRRLTALDREEKRREVFESRDRIADGLGAPVNGFRAPDFAIDRESLELVAEAGYAWDSSLTPSPRCARRLGLDAIGAAPHRPFPGSALVEVPLPGHAPFPLPFHPSYSLVLGGSYFRLALGRFRRTGAPLVLLFHLIDLADPLPRRLTPSLRSRFFTLSHLGGDAKRRRCAHMLQTVRAGFRITATSDLVAHGEDTA